MNGLETAARNFAISAKAGRLLERHRATVLMLRAKDATFSQIQDLLAQHGVTILTEPVDGPFGRTFTLQDPDGYAITIHDKG